MRLLALSADGSTAALADDSGIVHIWDVKTAKERWRVPFKGENELWDLALSRDGKMLLTSALGSKVVLWDVTKGKRLRALEIKPSGRQPDGGKDISTVQRLVFSADGKRMAAPFFDGPGKEGATAGLCIWDVETGKEIRRFSESEDGLDRLAPANVPPWMAFAALAPDGRTVARVALDGSVRLHDLADGKQLHRLGTGGNGPLVSGVVFAPDGKTLAVALRNRTALLYEAATGKMLRTVGEPVAMLNKKQWGLPQDFDSGEYSLGPGAAFAPDGKTLALVSGKNSLRLWDVRSGKERAGASGVSGSIEEVAVTADCKQVLTKATDGTLRCWEAATGKELRRQNWLAPFDGLGRAPEGTGVALSPAGRFLAVAEDNAVDLWDVVAAKPGGRVELPPLAGRGFGGAMRAPYQARFSGDEKVLATAEAAYEVRLWDPATGKALRRLTEDPREGREGNVNVHGLGLGLEVSPDGGAVVTGVFKGLVDGRTVGQTILRVWDTKTGTRKRWVMAGFVAAAAFSADGRSLATATAERIILWEVASGQERCHWNVAASRLACSPLGRVLAAAQGRDVLLVDMRTGKEFARLRGHAAEVRALAFSRAGDILVSGSADSTALVWGAPRLLPPPGKPAALSAKQEQALWDDLARADAARAYKAVVTLAASPKGAVRLGERIREDAAQETAAIQRLLTDLDSDTFKVRSKAQAELERRGAAARPFLEKARKTTRSPEVRRRIEDILGSLKPGQPLSAEELRRLRVVEVLEATRTSATEQVLEALAKGLPGVRLTREAAAALARLRR